MVYISKTYIQIWEAKTLENNEFIKYMNDWRTLNANYSELIPIYMKDWYWDAEIGRAHV